MPLNPAFDCFLLLTYMINKVIYDMSEGAMARMRILIIGGGASGALFAYHLLRTPRPDFAVTIVERSGELGFGLAYSTRDPAHLLNVRNSNMSALPDDPTHFRRWLARDRGVAVNDVDPDGFATRRSYGRYMASLLSEIRARHTDNGSYEVKRGVCVAIKATPQGVCAELASGATLDATAAIIATGHEHNPAPGLRDPWGSDPVDAESAVLVLGSGLTMIDYVFTLLARGHRGPIHVLSRRGLLPSLHQPVIPQQYVWSDIPGDATVVKLLHWMRREARAAETAGRDWRSVVDALRPHTQRLWQSLPDKERSRFLRHARPWWDIHRHRMAPEAARILDAATRTGQLRVQAGKVISIEPDSSGQRVSFRPRGSATIHELLVASIVDCMGLPTDPTSSTNPLISQLLASRQARSDALSLGLETTPECALVDATGQPSDRLFAIGPATRSQFWEIIAIPDIRTQCARLAEQLQARFVSRYASQPPATPRLLRAGAR